MLYQLPSSSESKMQKKNIFKKVIPIAQIKETSQSSKHAHTSTTAIICTACVINQSINQSDQWSIA